MSGVHDNPVRFKKITKADLLREIEDACRELRPYPDERIRRVVRRLQQVHHLSVTQG